MSGNKPAATGAAGPKRAAAGSGSQPFDAGSWDWQPGWRTVCDLSAFEMDQQPFGEIRFSPDGELTAWISMTDTGELQVRVNGQPWGQTQDNVWNLRFTPDNRLLALASSMGTWTLILDEESWPEEYEYIWSPLISRSGDVVSAAIKKDGLYGMAVNGRDWPTMYPNATDFTQSAEGSLRAAVVQTEPLDEGDIETFKKGVYSLAVNGRAWTRTFVNAWSPCLWESGGAVAASVRVGPAEYTIAVDGEPWSETYSAVWEPCFHPERGSVVAPVRLASGWALARDGQILWPARFVQLWHQQICRNGSIAAIVATRFGRFTVARDGVPWTNSYPVVNDLVLHEEGLRAAAIGQGGLRLSYDESQLSTQKWQVIVDDHPWKGWYDRAFRPVISPDGEHVAVRVERSGKWTVLVDDRAYSRSFDALWDPVFSPDGRKVLMKAIDGSQALRLVADLGEFGL